MTTIRIGVQQGGRLDFDLLDLLQILGDAVTASVWSARIKECVPRSGNQSELYSRYDAAARFSGAELLDLAQATHQVIDGSFAGWRGGANDPWIQLQAIDSTFWEITGADADLDAFRAKYVVVERDQPLAEPEDATAQECLGDAGGHEGT